MEVIGETLEKICHEDECKRKIKDPIAMPTCDDLGCAIVVEGGDV